MSIHSIMSMQRKNEERGLCHRAEEALLLRPPASEAEKNAYRTLLADLEARLRAIEDTANDRERIVHCLALLADKQGHVHDSIAYWSKLLPYVQALLDGIHLSLGDAYRRSSDLERSRHHLGRVSDDYHDAEHLRDVRSRLERRMLIESSIESAESVVAMSVSATNGDAHAAITESLRASLMKFGKSPSVRSMLCEAYDAAVAFRAAPPAPEATTRSVLSNYRDLRLDTCAGQKRPGVIFTSGFLWSGSGAVTDMLRGHSDTEIAAHGEELNLFQRTYSLLGMFDMPLGSVGPAELISFFLGPIAGLLVDRERAFKNRERSLFVSRLADGQGIDPCVEECTRLISQMKRIGEIPDADARSVELLRSLREFTNRMADSMRIRPGTSVVLNNNIFGFNARMLALFDNAMAVTVKRDPRDQYVAHFYERKRSDVMPIDTFIAKTRKRYDAHGKAMEQLGLSDRVVDIHFEDFVLKEQVRDEVLERLHLAPGRMREKSAFDPKKSSRNIGIHKTFQNQKHIRKIEKAFPDLLHR